MDDAAETLKYKKIWLTDFFHGFPHLDLSLQETDSTFDPESKEYRETLGVLGGFPIIWFALLWLFFLIFFCVRCCKKPKQRRGKALGTRLITWLFFLSACGSLAIAFYGNTAVHDGVGNFVQQVNNANQTVGGALSVFNTLDGIAGKVKEDVKSLSDAISGLPNVTIRNEIIGMLSTINSTVDTAEGKIASVKTDALKVNTAEVTDAVNDIENYRWIITICLYCIYIAIFLIAFTGLIKKSKWMMILVAVFSVISLLFVYAAMSVYLGLAVASGDLCVDPDTFVLSQVNGTIQQDILEAYVKCDDQSKPYQNEIIEAQSVVNTALTQLNQTVNMTLPFNITDKISGPVKDLQLELRSAVGNLSTLNTLVGSCGVIHDEYVLALTSLCSTMLIGAAYEVLSTALLGLFTAALAICASLLWPRFARRRLRYDYEPTDDTDPFLPNEPPRYGPTYGSMGEPAAGQRRHTGDWNGRDLNRPRSLNNSPPPAYQADHFMQQYHSLAPTPSSIVQSSQTAS